MFAIKWHIHCIQHLLITEIKGLPRFSSIILGITKYPDKELNTEGKLRFEAYLSNLLIPELSIRQTQVCDLPTDLHFPCLHKSPQPLSLSTPENRHVIGIRHDISKLIIVCVFAISTSCLKWMFAHYSAYRARVMNEATPN